MIKEEVDNYLSAVFRLYTGPDTKKTSYYTILEELLEKIWKILKKEEVEIIIVPKDGDIGNPDFVIKNSEANVVGYIETKDPGQDLDAIQNNIQLKRYREVFPNFILTNFLEFRSYRSGELKERAAIGVKDSLVERMGKTLYFRNQAEFIELFKRYFSFTFSTRIDARQLAGYLAIKSRFMRDMAVMKELEKPPGNNENNYITGFYNAFKTYLTHTLTEQEFADLYSQTLTFGLFTAAIDCRDKITRETAIRHIPHTNGILHDVFEFISMGSLPKQLECSLNDIVDILRKIDVRKILSEYFREKKGADPILHFYETFLSEYDPRLREKRGVYYTPRAVVSFIVRSIHIILKEKLSKTGGLANEKIKILDPAAGTSAFLAEVARMAAAEYTAKYGAGAGKTFARDYLPNNLYGFEIMMAPYAMAHLKMAYMLDEMGVKLKAGQRFKIYLTNTLEMEDIEQSDLPGMSSLSRESRRAGKIKKETPITVVLGNPPYAGHSLTNSETVIHFTGKQEKLKSMKVKTWIGEKIEDYKKINGQPLGERNPKWLHDDYVKFIRFAQCKIDDNGEGAVGFITNHSYLDNPTFRGMRRSLMESFDEIYILDLHGNALRREKSPDGSRDENVFDIRQGVAVGLFIKKNDGGEKKECRVFHADLWGLRKDKYKILANNDIGTIQWQEIFPFGEFYPFIPVRSKKSAASGAAAYQEFYKVTDIFPVHSVGIVTARDKLTVKTRKDEVMRIVKGFSGADEDKIRYFYHLGSDTRDWTVKDARKDLNESGPTVENVVPILYRPFDLRYTYYTGKSRGFLCMPRPEVMKHMLRENTGLITVRQVAEGVFNHCFITDTIVDGRITSSNKGIGYLFPLYLYPYSDPQGGKKGLFNKRGEPAVREVNISPRIFGLLKNTAGFKSLTAEQVFYYIYGLLFSTIYREKYAQELKMDFPRIPFTSDYGLFIEMGRLGERLAAVHLMKSPELDRTFSKFEVGNGNVVGRARFVTPGGGAETYGRIYVNNTQYFTNITPEIWEYRLAGYQVMRKWLMSRKGARLGAGEIEQYIKIARIIQLTIRYQHRIDRLYPQIEKRLIV